MSIYTKEYLPKKHQNYTIQLYNCFFRLYFAIVIHFKIIPLRTKLVTVSVKVTHAASKFLFIVSVLSTVSNEWIAKFQPTVL